MKKTISILLAVIMILTLVACGGANSAIKKSLVGTWELVDKETETEYGLGIEFLKDGTLRYGLTAEMLSGLNEGEELDEDELKALEFLIKMEYKIKSDTEMDVTVKALMGLKKETATVAYALNGDTLEFDGATYQRVK